MGKFPRKVMRFFCSHKDCEEWTNDCQGFETMEELEEHQAEHTISYEELERWQCVTCDELHEYKDDAYNCCG